MPSRLPFPSRHPPASGPAPSPSPSPALPARVLCPEDLLLHLCLHTGGDEHDPFLLGLRPLCDIDGVIRRQTVDWDALGARARSWRAAPLRNPRLGTGRGTPGRPRLLPPLLPASAPRAGTSNGSNSPANKPWLADTPIPPRPPALAPLETWQTPAALPPTPLSLAWRTLFPSRQHLDARAAARTAPAAGPCLGWITRAASLATRAARLSWHWLLHRRQSARQTALLRRRMQLRRWINDDSA